MLLIVTDISATSVYGRVTLQRVTGQCLLRQGFTVKSELFPDLLVWRRLAFKHNDPDIMKLGGSVTFPGLLLLPTQTETSLCTHLFLPDHQQRAFTHSHTEALTNNCHNLYSWTRSQQALVSSLCLKAA